VTLAARDLGAGEPEVLAQDLRERPADAGVELVRLAVD
jgi:hypothetical protein